MNRLYPIIVCAVLLTNCTNTTQQEHQEAKQSSLATSTQTQGVKDESVPLKQEAGKPEKAEKENAKAKNVKLSQVQALLARLDKRAKVEYSEPDKEILRNDTLVRTKHGDYKFDYSTACLNDSLVALEMFNYEAGYSKSYRLSHNYQTNIIMQHNGRPSGARVINKDIFRNKMQPDFLSKAVLKHPQFVRFDEEKNEAVFQFLVGVPATDYVVLAGVNLSPQGDIRIIDITTPKFEQ